jgi:hypothetical protein
VHFSLLTTLYLALFLTLPFNPLSFAYYALSRFTPVIFVLSHFNSLCVPYLVLSRFSWALPCFHPLCRVLTCFIALYPALHSLNCFSPLYFAFAQRIPLSSLLPISPFFPPSLLHARLYDFALLILFMPRYAKLPPICKLMLNLPLFLILMPNLFAFPYSYPFPFPLLMSRYFITFAPLILYLYLSCCPKFP